MSRRFVHRLRPVVAAAIFFSLLHATKSSAQELTGEIDGRITDATGAVIPGVKVVIRNEDQKIDVRTVQTNAEGQFSVPLLPVARYSVNVSATGFNASHVVTEVHTGTISSANVTLAAGSVTEAVDVTADSLIAPQTDSPAAGTLISSTKITQLSLSSRNFVQLVAIQPGVSGGAPGGTQDRGAISSQGTVNSANYEVNGIPPQYNGFFLDGQDLQRRSAGGTQIGAYPGIDFIQEINLQRSTFGAQYGGSGSAYVSVASKTGTNDFHGAAYSFVRSEIFNANNYFSNLVGTPRPLVRYNDFGYELDGPLYIPHFMKRASSKTFFVFGQEFLRSEQSTQTTLTNVPTTAQRLGNFTAPVCPSFNACGAVGVTTVPISTAAQAYLTDVIDKFPLPNSPSDPNGLIISEPGTNNETQTFVRIDHQFSQKVSGFFRFFNDPFNLRTPYGLRQAAQPPGVGTANVTDGDRAYYGAMTFILSPTNVLQGGGGYLRSYVTAQAIGSLLAANSPNVNALSGQLDTLSNSTGRIPNLVISSSTYATISPYTNGEPQTQVFANDTQTLGKHTLSSGFNLEWQKAGNNNATTNAGQYTFKVTTLPTTTTSNAANQFQQAFANFLDGSVSSFQQVGPDPSTYLHANVYEAYVQDDYHASPSLTLNFGLRYEYIVSPSSGTLQGHPYLPFVNFLPSHFNAATAATLNADGTLCVAATQAKCSTGVTANPNYNPYDGIIIANETSPYGSKVYTQPKTEFAPRLGFSYNVGGAGKTAIRGGFGIYYLQSTTADYGQLATANQPNITNVLINNTTFGNPVAPAANPTPQVLKAAQEIWQSPYTEVFSLDLQHTLWSSWLVDVGYYGNRALHLPLNEDINQPLPGAYQTQTTIGTAAVSATNTPILNRIRPYIGYGPINSDVQTFISNYNGLQTSVTKRFHDGSVVTANYTYSRALSNAINAPQNIYNPAAEYGNDNANRTHLFNFNFVYSLPFFRQQHGVLGNVLGGFEFSGIAGFASGQYLNVTTGAIDTAGQGLLATGTAEGAERPDYVSNPNQNAPHTRLKWFNTAAFVAPPPTSGRPGTSRPFSVIGPGYEDLDLSLFKNIHFYERLNGQIRFEAFNSFNHTNFTTISTSTNASNYGQATAAGANRVLQIAAKITF